MKARNKMYTITGVFLLLCFMLLAFFIYPVFLDIEKISKDILSKKIEAASLDVQNRELEAFKKNYKEYGASLEKVHQSFVDTQNPVGFIEFLEKIAADSNVDPDINLNTPPKKEGQAGTSPTVFQIFIKGDFLDILAFSEQLERGPYLIKVKNVSIKKVEKSTAGKGDGRKSVEANFLIEAVAN